MRTHYTFVADRVGPFGYQAFLLARSLIELAHVAPESITAHLVDGSHPSMERSLRSLGIRTESVNAFAHPYCNRIQALHRLDGIDADRLVLLDTDMFAVDALDLPLSSSIMGKMVDAPNPRIDVLTRIFHSAGLPLVDGHSDVIVGPTVRANFNGGLYVVPTTHQRVLAEAWTRWARWSLAHVDLFDAWSMHIDQVSFALAVAEQSLPIESLPREFNAPTHLGDIGQMVKPRILHYHRHVDSQWLLTPSGDPAIDGSVDVANGAIRDWRRQDLVNDLFWTARYAVTPELGSGVGSRGAHLDLKRQLLQRLVKLLRVTSIVDIGGGDGSVMEGLVGNGELRATDAAPGAEAEYLRRNPDARFTVSNVAEHPVEPADLAVCLDVLIHQADVSAYRRAVHNVLASARVAALISGFDGRSPWQSSLTSFHEPLYETLTTEAAGAIFPVLADRGSTCYLVLKDVGPPLATNSTASLQRAISICGDPLGLLECVVRSREVTGSIPDDPTWSLACPWILKRIRSTGRSGLQVLGIGGTSVLPTVLRDDGHRVTTIAPVAGDDFQPARPLDVLYGIGVVECLPAEQRPIAVARMARQMADGGLVLLTVAVEPVSRRLWRHLDDVEIESTSSHGTIDHLIEELQRAGFRVKEERVVEWLPASSVGVALIAATVAASEGRHR